MRKNRRPALLFTILFIVVNTGCIPNPYKYKDGRLAHKIYTSDFPVSMNQPGEISLFKQNIVVFPFIDHRKTEDIQYATSLPLSVLLPQAFVVNAEESGIFRKIAMAPEEHYAGLTHFNKETMNHTKENLNAGGIIWGNINSANIRVEDGNATKEFKLVIHVAGNMHLMLSDGTIHYTNYFNKKRSYDFKGTGWFSHTNDDIYKLGKYVKHFLNWVSKGEIEKIISDSDLIKKGVLRAENVMPETLDYPPPNTAVYDYQAALDIKNMEQIASSVGSLVGGIGGAIATNHIINGDSSSNGGYAGWSALFIGFPLGMILGSLTGHFAVQWAVNDMLEDISFYAQYQIYDPYVVSDISLLSINF